MMKRLAVAVASCLALGACGGNDGGGNAALSKNFTYGTPVPSSQLQASAVDGQVATALSLRSSPSASSAQSLADFSSLTATLLEDGTGMPLAASPQQKLAITAGRRAVAARLTSTTGSSFDVPTCVTTSATEVDFNGCTITIDETTTQGVVQVGGYVKVDPAAGTLDWKLTISSNGLTDPYEPTFSMTLGFSEEGHLAVTDTTIKGQMLAGMDLTMRQSGQSVSAGVDESLELDLTYADAAVCASRVTAGTLVAKRVWTVRPQGATAADLADRSAVVTWTACGQGTFAKSW